MCALLFFLTQLCVRAFKTDAGLDAELPKNYVLTALIVPLLSCIAAFSVTMATYHGGAVTAWMAGIWCLLLLIINVVVASLYKKLLNEQKDKLEKTMMDQQNKAYANELSLLKQTSRQIRSLRDDMKRHISTVEGLYRSGNIAELDSYLDGFVTQVEQTRKYLNTGFAELDSILNYKLSAAEGAGIAVETSVVVPDSLAVEPFDLNVILGNLLDNAVEGALRCQDKKLVLNLRFDRGVFYIDIQNTYDGVVNQKSGGAYLTRKEQADLHGLGLLAVRRAVEKYNGHMEITHTEKHFSVRVMLYPEKE